MKKSCNNCADYIVCYGMEEITEEKGESCPNWQMDFSDYQELFHIDLSEDNRNKQ